MMPGIEIASRLKRAGYYQPPWQTSKPYSHLVLHNLHSGLNGCLSKRGSDAPLILAAQRYLRSAALSLLTLDALHLAIAIQFHISDFTTADLQWADAALALGLNVSTHIQLKS
ncbi:MAG: hypothetical protein Q8M09_14255 [Pseudomonadota bacterium]|nr:hypothetical protein [Pseudomonadota bacterium]MDP1905387.1 hypothetical protein [Pseudomonadota bacterium]MDP2354157.1 hypothetical protein [Pseudomonadota bacterium]